MNYGIVDGSGDKEYFTIIPNYIINHSTANDQALYLQMKRHAGEKGVCFVSETVLREKLGITKMKLKKSLKYLIEHKWIEYVGNKIVQTPGGKQPIKCYKICNLWKQNKDHFRGGSKINPPHTHEGGRKTMQGGSEIASEGGRNRTTKNISEEDNEEDKNFLFLNTEERKQKAQDYIQQMLKHVSK